MRDPDIPSGTVTFLFTDIERSTRLWLEQPDAMAGAVAEHDEILRTAIEAADGHVFATGGDAFAAAFESASDAVDAALGSQLRLILHNWGDVAPRVRMGIHSGEAEERDANYYGPGLAVRGSHVRIH